MYTLENHLQRLSTENKEFEILNSIWKLNKQQLPAAQSTISFNFPHYSMHEVSHSKTIVKNIESFLGEDRIQTLSASDTWMILMAAYTHDLGMVIFNEALEEKWVDDSFQDYLLELSFNSTDLDLKRSASLLLEIEKKVVSSSSQEDSHRIKLPLEIRRSIILIIADFFRKTHHIRSQEMLAGKDEDFHKAINGFNLNGLPNRFHNLLGDVAYSHGTDFYSIIERLEYECNGYGSDKMHPRFIAFMLRLGDLLDIDDKRFNLFNEKVLDNQLPHSSNLHKEKHASTKHLLVSPKSIEATVDCKSDEVYRIAKDWFDWLEKEVENQSKEWSSIAPKELLGLPPTISKGKLRVLYKSAEPKDELMNLRFSISNKKVFEMFEGSAIYENSEFVFIRELVQNAIDASKIKIWKLISSGIYDYSIRRHLGIDRTKSHSDVINAIKYPVDIPDEILESFDISLKINWTDSLQDHLVIEIKDNGIGISEKDLIRMTQKVGESRSQDREFQKFRRSMPYWMKPTGAFGIGLQSLFLLTPNFTVQTKFENEEGKEIIFQSAKNGEYSKITSTKVSIDSGTKVTLIIPRNKFVDVFSNTFSMDVIDNYDYFSDGFGDIYMHKIKKYIEDELRYVGGLNVTMFGQEILTPESHRDNPEEYYKKISIVRDEDMMCTLLEPTDYQDSHVFLFYERLISGTEISLRFFDKIHKERDYYTAYHKENKEVYLVRSIPVEERFPSFYKTTYCTVICDLQSPDSDKILNISRDKLIKKAKRKFETGFLNIFLPKAIRMVITLFEEKYGSNINNDLKVAVEYFHIELTANMVKLPTTNNRNIYSEFKLQPLIATDVLLREIKLIDFFSLEEVFFINKKYPSDQEKKKDNIQEVWLRFQKQNNINDGMVIWDQKYLEDYFVQSGFMLNEFTIYDDTDGLPVTIKKLLKSNKLSLSINPMGRKQLISSETIQDYTLRRAHFYPVEPYAKFLAVNDVSYDGFVYLPIFLETCIISPFINRKQYNKLLTELKQPGVSLDRQNVRTYLQKNWIDELVPQKLSDWIITNNLHSSQDTLTREVILENYSELILEILGNDLSIS